MQAELYNAPYVPRNINDVFGADVNDIHNTNHGSIPGQERATDPEPKLLASANATTTTNTTVAANATVTLPAEIAKSAA